MRKLIFWGLILACLFGSAINSFAADWTVSNVYESMPGEYSAIDWPLALHDKLNTGEYLKVGPEYYFVAWSDYCDPVSWPYCPSGNVWADLQQINLIDGIPLDAPGIPEFYLMADITGTEGMLLEVYAAWPGPPATWDVSNIYPGGLPAGPNSLIDWPYNIHDRLVPGEYLKVGASYYYVLFSDYCETGMWPYCPDGNVWADLQQVNLINGSPLDDPANPGYELMAEMTGSEGLSLETYTTWPYIVLPPPETSWGPITVGSIGYITWGSTPEDDTMNSQAYLRINGKFFFVESSGEGYANLQECDQFDGSPMEDPGSPGQPLMADMTGTEGSTIEHYSFWPDITYTSPHSWEVSNVYPGGLPAGPDSLIDWPYNLHDKLNAGEYLKVGTSYYSVLFSDYCETGMWPYCPTGNVWADLQQINLIDGSPLEDPNNPGYELMADLAGTSGEAITLFTSWPGYNPSWMITNASEMIPGYASIIEWNTAVHGALMPDDYVRLDGKYYSVIFSEDCADIYCPSGITVADLQQVNQSTGIPLEDPQSPGQPLPADMAGMIGEAIESFNYWPGLQASWPIANVNDNPPYSDIDWEAIDYGVLSPGHYVKIDGILYVVNASSAGSWVTPGNNQATLKQCNQFDGTPLEDPVVPDTPLWADMRNTDGKLIEYFPAWPGSNLRWAVSDVYQGGLPAGPDSLIDWPYNLHDRLIPGEYLKVGTSYYYVVFSDYCTGTGSWPYCPLGNVWADLQQVNLLDGSPLEDPLNSGYELMADMIGSEGMPIDSFKSWPDYSPQAITSWEMYSTSYPNQIDWLATDHDPVSESSYLKLDGILYYVIYSYTCSVNGCDYNFADLQEVDQYGNPLLDTYGSPAYPDLSNIQNPAIEYFPTWPGASGSWSIETIDPGNPAKISWYDDCSGSALEPGSYVRVGGVLYSVSDSGYDTCSGWIELQQCDQFSGDPLYDNKFGQPLWADMTDMANQQLDHYLLWPGNNLSWAVSNVYQGGLPAGPDSLIDWPYNLHDRLIPGEYLKVGTSYYYVVFSDYCTDTGSWPYCPTGNVWADLQEINLLDGTPLDDPLNSGYELMADMTGTEGKGLEQLPTWITDYPTWNIFSVEGTTEEAIDWLTSSYGVLNVGNYVLLDEIYYYVIDSGADSWWNTPYEDYNFAALQQVNQFNGRRLWKDPGTDTVPLMANLAGTAGMGIELHTSWPGPNERCYIDTFSASPVSNNEISWYYYYQCGDVVNPGSYVKIDSTLYYVLSSRFDGSYYYASLQESSQLDGTSLTDPAFPGKPLLPDVSNMPRGAIDFYPVWPGSNLRWAVSDVYQGGLPAGPDSLIDWPYNLHDRLIPGEYLKVGTSYYYVVFSDYCTGTGSWPYCPLGNVWADLQQVNLLDGSPLEAPNNPGYELMADMTGSEGVAIELVPDWPISPPPIASWTISTAGGMGGIDWPVTSHITVDRGDYVRVGGTFYYVDYFNNGSCMGTAGIPPCDENYFETALVQVSQLNGAVLEDPLNPGYPIWADMTGMDGQQIELFKSFPYRWGVNEIYDGGWGIGSLIDWPYSLHVPIPAGEYLEVNNVYYYVFDSGYCDPQVQYCPTGNVYAELQQVNLIDGTPLEQPGNPGWPMMGDLSGSQWADTVHSPTWSGPQATWTVESVSDMWIPGEFSFIIWPYNVHDPLSYFGGEYVTINGTIYFVGGSDHCDGNNCPTGKIFADLLLIEQATGKVLVDSGSGFPLGAEMSTQVGQEITIYTGYPDSDGDGFVNGNDNCPAVSNVGQSDLDGDEVGDACDNCLNDPNQGQKDWNQDGNGDACQDSDSDNLLDAAEILAGTSPILIDTDGDGNSDYDEIVAYGTDPLVPNDGSPVLSGVYHSGEIMDDFVIPLQSIGDYLTNRNEWTFDGTVYGTYEEKATSTGSLDDPGAFFYDPATDYSFNIVGSTAMIGNISTDERVFIIGDADPVDPPDGALALTVGGLQGSGMDESYLTGNYVATQYRDTNESGVPAIDTNRQLLVFDGVVASGTYTSSTWADSAFGNPEAVVPVTDEPYTVSDLGVLVTSDGTGFVTDDSQLMVTTDTTIGNEISLTVGVKQGSCAGVEDLFGAFAFYEIGYETYTWSSRIQVNFNGNGGGTFERQLDSDGQEGPGVTIIYDVDTDCNVTIDGTVTGVLSENSEYLVIADTDWAGGDPGVSMSVGVRTANVYPTCVDGIHNGTETGIDCGGSCGTCPVAEITYPNGGETLTARHRYDITWTPSSGADIYRVYYSLDGGGNWTYIGKVDSPVTQLTLDIPELASSSSTCLVRVISYDIDNNVIAGDTSDSNFTIVLPDEGLILQPNGGETLVGGTDYEIRWSNLTGASYYRIYYSTVGGAPWTYLGKHYSPQNSLVWRVDDGAATEPNCIFRVIAYDASNNIMFVDGSDADFTMEPNPSPNIPARMIYPNGDETLMSEDEIVVQWTPATNVTTNRLYYSVNGGAPWIYLGKFGDISTFNWTVPDVATIQSNCVFRVNAYNATNDFISTGRSDNPFTIIPNPSPTLPPEVTYPNGGEVFTSGSGITATWNPGTNVDVNRLYYSTNNGGSWIYLGKVANVSSYSWTLPVVGVTNPNFIFRVDTYNIDNKFLRSDISDGSFTINP